MNLSPLNKEMFYYFLVSNPNSHPRISTPIPQGFHVLWKGQQIGEFNLQMQSNSKLVNNKLNGKLQ